MKSKKVILIYTNARIRNQKPRPPLGLLYLAQALRAEFEPIIIDMRTEKNAVKLLKEHLSDCLFVGISTIIGQQIVFSLETAKFIKSIAPQVTIVFGGVFPSMVPELVLKEDVIDIVSIGDGEDTLCMLAEAMSQDRDISGIPGIAYKKNGKIVVNKTANTRKLDNPIMPAWDMVDLDDYREINVLTSKGCTGVCTFCYNRIYNNGCFRLRPTKNIWQEISMLHLIYGVKHIAFVDDNFFGDLKHSKEVMQLFRDSGYGLTWETTCRANDFASFDSQTLELIRDSGCKELFIGFESSSDKVLKSMKKNIAPDLTGICMERARHYGITIRALYVIGFVSETKQDLFHTLDIVDYLRTNYGDCVKIPVFGIYTPYPQMPPDMSRLDGKTYIEPQTMEGWSVYHHDRANHQWLSKRERNYLETVIWVYRYYSKRNKFTRNGGWKDKLLYYDAIMRWKFRFFSFAPEWKRVRQAETAVYQNALMHLKKEFETEATASHAK